MAQSQAIFCTAVGEVEIRSVPQPTLVPGHVLVRTKAVALNPTDWKSIHDPSGSAVGARLGVDFAGVVEEIGPGLSRPFEKGDRVCGSVFGGKDAETGAFSDLIAAKEHMVFKIPDQLSFEQASTLGVGVATCGQALCQLLGLPLPPSDVNSPNKTILIGGGSTATAVLGIQYAKLSGLRVIATASPYNFDYIESLGADAVLDYHEPTEDLVAKIKEATAAGGGDGSLTMAWDCSPNETFHKVAALAMSTTDAGIYATVDPMTPPDLLRDTNPMVQCKTQLAYTVFGEEFSLGPYTFPASREDVELHGAFWKRTLLLLGENKLHPTRVTVNRGGDGLSGVIIGLDELSQGKVAGSKLVYSL